VLDRISLFYSGLDSGYDAFCQKQGWMVYARAAFWLLSLKTVIDCAFSILQLDMSSTASQM
jgi:hypothetical protein